MAGPQSSYLEIIERDSAGAVTSSYVASNTSTSQASEIKSSTKNPATRVDKVPLKDKKSYMQQLLDVFLPAGYPHSVTEDYIQYQIYDSLQAFSSSIAGLLASRAVLEGVGVGDASASPTAALLLSILQESTGRIATILFAHKLGTSLEPECKMYRLLADIFNDAAMILDCLSPAFPRPGRVLVLSFSSTLRALCGVCAGSAKASLSAHFATKGNLGELNAKDSSQETVISLLGMLAGSVVVSWVATPIATWATLIALLSIHLATNYAAVTAVSMRSLNRQRANIVFSTMLQDGSVLSPTEVSRRERVFERDGVLRWADDCIIGHCTIGASMEQLLRSLSINSAAAGDHQSRGARQQQGQGLSEVLQLYVAEAYLLWFAGSEVIIVLKDDCTAVDSLKAWTQALMLAQRLKSATERRLLAKSEQSFQDSLAVAKSTLEATTQLFETCVEKLKSEGWDLDTAALETRAGLRVTVHAPGEKM